MKKLRKFIYMYFILLPFIDLFTSLTTRFLSFPISIGTIIKGISLLFIMLYILFFNKEDKKSKIFLIVLFLAFSFHLLINIKYLSLSILLQEITLFTKYYYYPIMLIGFYFVFKNFEFKKKDIEKIFIYTIMSYSFFMLFPLLTGTYFDSYDLGMMSGNNGWFYAANETGGVLICLLIYSSYFLKNKNKYLFLLIIPLCISLTFIGTKVTFLGEIFILFLMIFFNFFKKEKIKYFYFIFLLALATFSIIFSPTVKNFTFSLDYFDYLNDDKKDNVDNYDNNTKINNSINNNDYPKTNNEITVDIDDKSDSVKKNDYYPTVNDLTDNTFLRKILNIGFSNRINYLLQNGYTFYNSSIKYRFFGLGWGDNDSINYTYSKKMIEIDLADIFIHYGYFGIILFLLPLFYGVYKIFKTKVIFSMDNIFLVLSILLMFGIACTSGHILSAPSVSIYLVLLSLLIFYNKKGNRL